MSCQHWTSTCAVGYAWSPGSATANAVCTPCASLGNGQEALYVPNTCNFTCNAGWQVVGLGCQQCPPGKYKNSAAGAPCASCAANTYQNSAGQAQCMVVPVNATAINQSAGVACNQGYYMQAVSVTSVAISCGACQAGTYTSGLTQLSYCTACLLGTFNTQAASTACAPCPNQTFANVYGATACSPWTLSCSAGFAWSAGTSSQNAVCTACSTPATWVYVYVPNTCTFTCNVGYQVVAGLCQGCAAGTFKPDASRSNCSACSAGGYQSLAGASGCVACANGTFAPAGGLSVCIQCGAGLYSGGGSTTCMACSVGTYSTGMGISACSACAAGQANGRGSTYCYALGSRTAYFQPGISLTCQWLYFAQYSQSACGGNAQSVWNENNGALLAAGTCPVANQCDLAQRTLGCGSSVLWSGYVGVSISLTWWPFEYQPGVCSQCYQSVGSVARVPSNCSSSQPPTVELCYMLNSSSGCGCFKSQVSSTALCHSCSAGYYSQVPAFTVCVACASGTYSSGVGMVDTVEWANGTYSNSSWMAGVDCRMPQLDAEGGWCPATVSAGEWSQLDLGSAQTVKGLVTQGRATAQQWATSVALMASMDGKTWGSPATSVQANMDSYTRQVSFFSAPLVARYLRVSPGSYSGWFSLRWNALVQVTVCSGCAPGTYSPAINVPGCLACPGALPSNAVYPWSGCAWICNAGYYVAGAGCGTCSDSSGCAAGQFRPLCTNGITNNQTCSGTCSNKPQNAQAVYLGPSADNTGNSCPWGCNAGFFKLNATQNCANCTVSCSVGQYASFGCPAPSVVALQGGPACVGCSGVANAVFVGPGQAGNASSCPFQCNGGFLTQGVACQAWTATCNAGYAWSAGTATANAQCTQCPSISGAQAALYLVNQCNYTCNAGWQMLGGGCQQCGAGKYKSSNAAVSCTSCAPNTYQSSVGQVQCTPVPANGVAVNQSTGVQCNVGFQYSVSPVLGISCVACPMSTANTKAVVWSGCAVLSLLCNQGYYRNWTAPGCLACPGLPNSSTAGLLNVSALCGTCTGASAVQDEIVGCPFTCNVGYYAAGYGCVRCATVSCTLGQYAQLCTGGATADACLGCSYQLSTSQVWVSQCQWECAAGYNLTSSQTACVLCASGMYKPSAGNQSCQTCPAGSYAASQVSCSACGGGTYSGRAMATVCTACANGSVAAGPNATACTSCAAMGTWPNSFALTSTACALCTWALPVSSGTGCLGLQPPCVAGYYVYLGACAPCPSGTYCPSGGVAVFCPVGQALSTMPATAMTNCTAGQSGAVCAPNSGGQPPCIPNAGYYGFAATLCPYDAYCPAGSLVPVSCPGGTTAPMGSVAAGNCTRYMVQPCRPGYYANGTYAYCLGCATGCFCPGQSVIVRCNASLGKYYSAALATAASQCVNGTPSSSACPANTQSAATVLVSPWQCVANAGYYALPGLAGVGCPINFYCARGALIPAACPPPMSVCGEMGQYPTLALCPQGGMAAPLAYCQNCSGPPANAYWTSQSDSACPFCCVGNYYRYSNVCNAQPDTSTCAVGQYVPGTGACETSVQACVACPAIGSGGLSFLNLTFRNTFGALGYGTAACLVGCGNGFYLYNQTCVPCSAGYYKNWIGNSSQCGACPQGTFASAQGASVCTVCPPFAISTPQGSGCSCLAGLYMQINRTCAACPAGSVSAGGASVCSQCIAGTVWSSYLGH